MAYGVKYRMNIKDEFDISYEIDILQDGYVGGINTMEGSSSFPISINMPGEDDPFNPVCTTNATVGIVDTVGDTYVEFFTADVYEYFVDIKRLGVTYWKGFLITEEYEEEFTTEPYGVTLTFGDGLNELAFERYDNGGTLRSTHETVINILVNCFSELPSVMDRPFREMINVFDDTMDDTDSEGLLEQLFIYEQAFWELDGDDSLVKGVDCLKVIKGIMRSLGCRIIVSQNKWYIQRIKDMKTTGGIQVVDYDSSGVNTGFFSLDLRQPISSPTASIPDLLRHIANQSRNRFSRQYQEIGFSYTSRNITTLSNNLSINWDFTKGYELEGTSVVPLHYGRSAAVDTQLGVDPTGLHLASVGQDGNFLFEQVQTTRAVLVMEDSLLVKTKITSGITFSNNVLLVDPTRETFFLTPESPADNTVMYKNLLHSTSDHIEIRLKGYYDYTYSSQQNVGLGGMMMFNKWTIQLGSNFYNIKNQAWTTAPVNRVFHREWNNQADVYVDQDNLIRRHQFDFIVTLANFITTGISDLTVTWFIPETSRIPIGNYSTEGVSNVDIVFETVQIEYVSDNTTEFSIQKALGEDSYNRSLF